MRKRSIVFGFSLLLSAAAFAVSAERQKGGAESEMVEESKMTEIEVQVQVIARVEGLVRVRPLVRVIEVLQAGKGTRTEAAGRTGRRQEKLSNDRAATRSCHRVSVLRGHELLPERAVWRGADGQVPRPS